MRGGSEFERAVWAEIAKIPYGEMVTYGSIATALGDPGAARAVGTACNHNPVPVIVPCHRVVGAGGKMVGFGGGLDRKRKLARSSRARSQPSTRDLAVDDRSPAQDASGTGVRESEVDEQRPAATAGRPFCC